MSNREFDALFPHRETGFESPYDSVELDFDFLVDDWDVLDTIWRVKNRERRWKRMDELLKRIEEARNHMYQLVECYSLWAPQVVEQSQRLDGLLNSYYHMKERKSA